MNLLQRIFAIKDDERIPVEEAAVLLKVAGVDVSKFPQMDKLDGPEFDRYSAWFRCLKTKRVKTKNGIKTQVRGKYCLQAHVANFDDEGHAVPGIPFYHKFIAADGELWVSDPKY